jgi:hypothetical protein
MADEALKREREEIGREQKLIDSLLDMVEFMDKFVIFCSKKLKNKAYTK